MTIDSRSFLYVDTDIPPEITLSSWRHARHAASHKAERRFVRSFLRRAFCFVRPIV